MRFLTDPDDPVTPYVVLAAAELITNVIRHTGSGGVLQAWDPKPDVPLRLEVADFEPRSPQVVQDAGGAGGFGLRIVNTLADAASNGHTGSGPVYWLGLPI